MDAGEVWYNYSPFPVQQDSADTARGALSRWDPFWWQEIKVQVWRVLPGYEAANAR